jgi:hypothetical protein
MRVATWTFLALAAILVSAQCGGSAESAPPTATHRATTTAAAGSETGPTTEQSATTGGATYAYFEGKTFTFEYPIVWTVLRPTSQLEPEPLESALVGPGNQTDAVTMYVFRARGFDTDQEARAHIASLRRDIRRNGGRIIEGPTAFRSPKDDFTAFFVSFASSESSGRIVRQIGLIYFRGRVYRFTCEFLSSHGAAMDEGCKHALETLKIEGLGKVPA